MVAVLQIVENYTLDVPLPSTLTLEIRLGTACRKETVMKYCWNKPHGKTKEKWEKEKLWHWKYLWYPKIIKLEDGTRCLVWLQYVQRRSTESYDSWRQYPTIRDYAWRL